MTLSVHNLSVAVEDKTILNSLSLSFEAGRTYALMGPNGSGKSSLAMVLAGHPAYTVRGGSVKFLEQNLLDLTPDKRAKLGLFVAFQYPQVIPGLGVFQFLKTIYEAVHGSVEATAFHALAVQKMQLLGMDECYLDRSVNEGFSGGEKKRLEVLQLLLLQPKLAVIDEIDSGLDVDALQAVSKAIIACKQENPHMTLLLITHYQRILQYITPDTVVVVIDGSLAKTGNAALAEAIEQGGYAILQK